MPKLFHENVPRRGKCSTPGRARLLRLGLNSISRKKMFHDAQNVPQECSTMPKCSTKLFHDARNVPHYAKNLSIKRRKVKIGVALRKTPVILFYMENNTTQKTVAEIRTEIEDIRSQMCGKFLYIGMFDKSFFSLYTKEELVQRLAEIASESKQLQNQYDQKISEMLNAKS